MTSLREVRRELADVLQDACGVPAYAAPQTNVNPPCVVVQPRQADSYTSDETWSTDRVHLAVLLLVRSGDPAAVLDALDDLIDLTRAALQQPTPSGLQISATSTGSPGTYVVGTQQVQGVAIDVDIERNKPV